MYDLPKIVWTHWDSNDLPELCRLCLGRTRRMLPDWDVRFITTPEFLKLCSPPAEFGSLAKQAQSDFIRLWLLKEYGGTWMDISIVLNKSLNDLYDESVTKQAECTGFYLDGYTTNAAYPVFESWFIMAPIGSRVIASWYEEFYKAVTMGFAKYKKAAQAEGVDMQRIFQNESDTYLTIHLCYQVVIQKRMQANILYKKAEDTMYSVHQKCVFDGSCMKTEFAKPAVRDIPYIKLRGGDRALFPVTYFADYDFTWWFLLFCIAIGIAAIAVITITWPAIPEISGKWLARLYKGVRRAL